jgi:hypothetical protein
VLGRRGWRIGPPWAVACAGEKRKEKACRPELVAGQNRRKGEREGEGKGFSFFFLNFFSNSFFKHSNFNQTKSMHSNHDAQALIISKLF